MKKAHPLSWPDNWKITPKDKRRNLGSRMSLYKAARSLEVELAKLGATDAILSTNVPFSANGAYAERYNGDPGAAVYFKYKNTSLVMACDHYFYVNNNVRGLALTIEAMRAIERHGASDMMERAFRGFTALPEQAGEFWREVLEIPPAARPTKEDIEKHFRALAHIYHPDKGGTHEEWLRLSLARENALRDIGATR